GSLPAAMGLIDNLSKWAFNFNEEQTLFVLQTYVAANDLAGARKFIEDRSFQWVDGLPSNRGRDRRVLLIHADLVDGMGPSDGWSAWAGDRKKPGVLMRYRCDPPTHRITYRVRNVWTDVSFFFSGGVLFQKAADGRFVTVGPGDIAEDSLPIEDCSK